MKLCFDELPAGLSLTQCIPEPGDAELTIPEGVVYLSDAALRLCTHILRLSLPSTIRLDDGAVFSPMSSLMFIDVSPDHPCLCSMDGVLCIRRNGLRGLTLLRYPAGRRAKRYAVPEAVHTIGRHAFAHTVSLEVIDLHSRIFDIGEGAFSMCHKLCAVCLSSERLLYLREGAFRFCKSLKRIRFEGVVECVEARVFDGCTALRSVEFPDGLTNLGSEAFCRCTALRSVVRPPSLVSIGSDVFYDCARLELIRCTQAAARLMPAYLSDAELSSITCASIPCTSP